MKSNLAKFLFLLLPLLGVGATTLYFLENKNVSKANPLLSQIDLEINEKTFKVEVATTLKEQEAGLSNRKHLEKDHGMLFVFDTPNIKTFWMKNTFIPLDILYFDEFGNLVKAYPNAPPCKKMLCPTYSSQKPIKYVVELNGGTISSWGEETIRNTKINIPAIE